MPSAQRPFARLASGLMLCMLLGGCATLPDLSSSTLPATVLLDKVPFVAQEAHSCGPASLAMVLQYYGRHRTQASLKPLLVLPDREGTLQIEMTAAARREGYLALAGTSTLETLLADVAAGFPVIVLQNLRFSAWPQWHYAVVIGYDRDKEILLLRSGDNALIEESFNTFLNTWQRSGRWTLVIAPSARIPPSATAESVSAAAEALVASRYPARALAGYYLGVKRWPDTLPLWNGLGNLAYTERQWALARHAFENSLQRNATQARVWNNFAYTLQQSGCTALAETALTCAEQLAPTDALIVGSRADLLHKVPASDQACVTRIDHCHIVSDTNNGPRLHLQ